MLINVIAVGKVRESFLKSGIEEFTKRIQPYSSFKITEIDSENLKNDENKAVETEGEKIISILPSSSFVILLDVKGKKLSSEAFAAKISSIGAEGINQVVFIIGGALGVSQKVKNRADFALSFSDMTFPHQMARLMLVEQIYRTFRIINNEPYHK